MALTAGDIEILDQLEDTVNRTQYTTGSVTYVLDDEYIFVAAGEDDSAEDGNNSLGVPSTTGVTWTEIPNAEVVQNRVGMKAYLGVCTIGGTETTDITYPTTQKNCNAVILHKTNTFSIVGVTTSTDVNTKSISVTIPAVDSTSISLSFFSAESSGTWFPGTGETQLTDNGDGRVSISAQYNLGTDNVLDAYYTDPSTALYVVAIGMELEFFDSGALTIESVNGGNTIADGDTPVEIVVTNAGAFQGGTISQVWIGATSVYADATVKQAILADGWIDTLLKISVGLPTGSSSSNPVYVFVDNGTEVVSTIVSVTPASTPTLHTLSLNSIVCEAVDFSTGISASVYRGGGATEEVATLITEVSNANTATPQLMVTYPNGAPGAGDTVTVSYDSTLGSIKSVTGSVALASFTDLAGVTCA